MAFSAMAGSGELRGGEGRCGGGISYRRVSQQSKEVLVHRRRTAVEEQQPVGPVQRGGQTLAGGGGGDFVLLHVEDGGQQGRLELLQLLLQ